MQAIDDLLLGFAAILGGCQAGLNSKGSLLLFAKILHLQTSRLQASSKTHVTHNAANPQHTSSIIVGKTDLWQCESPRTKVRAYIKDQN